MVFAAKNCKHILLPKRYITFKKQSEMNTILYTLSITTRNIRVPRVRVACIGFQSWPATCPPRRRIQNLRLAEGVGHLPGTPGTRHGDKSKHPKPLENSEVNLPQRPQLKFRSLGCSPPTNRFLFSSLLPDVQEPISCTRNGFDLDRSAGCTRKQDGSPVVNLLPPDASQNDSL